MGKLDDSLGYNSQFEKKISEATNKQFSDEFNGRKDIFSIPLKDICLRYSNNYINDKKTFNSLITSIKKNGLLQPIIVAEINPYLPMASEEEKEYLVKMQKKYGSKYFVISGHRRFKAYTSLALRKIIFNDEDIDKFHSLNLGDKLYKEYKNAELRGQYDKLNEFLFIPCQITKDVTNESEKKVYNDTNLTARPTTNFEFVVNSIEPSGVDNTIAAKSKENAEIIRKYIDENYGISVPAQSIVKYLQLIRELPKGYIDCIFEGKLSIRDAVNLINKITDDNKGEILTKIKQGKFDYKNEFVRKSNSAKPSKKNKIKVYQRLIDKYGDIKLSELIEKIKREG